MLISERHSRILDILRQQQTVTVAQLSELLAVSPVTIRSDLNQLAEQGQITRIHGGATLVSERVGQEFTFATRQRLRAAQKHAIGELAAQLVQPVESILLDASSTALAVGQAIKRRGITDLTVLTTGIWTAMELLGAPGLSIILTGGNLRSTTGSITGPIAKEVLQKFNLHKAFLGAWGLTLEEGLTDTNLHEVTLKQTIIERCQEVIAVVDSSKLGQIGLASFAPLDRVSTVVTDSAAAPALVDALRARGIRVMIARVDATNSPES
jgi:DeoR/GlpR family transcriptional regulator of sugar metabolism